jgi:hypothetical protein
MADKNGNQYPAWLISARGEIQAVTADGNIKTMSPPDFAYDLGISDDGTVWVVSTTPDPDGGGGKIFWGLGDGKWNEINTPNPGAAGITGTGPGYCFYSTAGGDLWQLQTNGAARRENFVQGVVEVDYGSGGSLWATFPDKPGEVATLHFGFFGPNPFTWKLFPGSVSPTSISANSNRNCYGLIDGKPVEYRPDGTSYITDKGAKRGMSLSFKQGSVSGQDRFYLTTANGNQNGNEVMFFQGVNGWTDAGFRAIYTLATYYTHR